MCSPIYGQLPIKMDVSVDIKESMSHKAELFGGVSHLTTSFEVNFSDKWCNISNIAQTHCYLNREAQVNLISSDLEAALNSAVSKCTHWLLC